MNTDQALSSEDEALDAEPWCAEVQQEPSPNPCGPEKVEKLRFMNDVDYPRCLELDDDLLVDQKVGKEAADDYVVVYDPYCLLLRDNVTEFSNLMPQRILVHFLQNSDAENVADA